MPNHVLVRTYSFRNLVAAYGGDKASINDPRYLIFKGDKILALCLRNYYNQDPGEVCVGDIEAFAKWGAKLAALKGGKSIPLYYAKRHLFEYKGQYLITGDTEDAGELAQRHSPVPLSRIVFLRAVPQSDAAPTLAELAA